MLSADFSDGLDVFGLVIRDAEDVCFGSPLAFFSYFLFVLSFPVQTWE